MFGVKMLFLNNRDALIVLIGLSDIRELTNNLCSYITFCEDTVIPKEHVEMFPNNKKWVTKSLKNVQDRKHRAFLKGDETDRREAEQILPIGPSNNIKTT